MALVLLALRALLCVALRRPALPCVRFVFSGRDELITVSDVWNKYCFKLFQLERILVVNALGFSAGRSRAAVRAQCIGAVGGDRPVVTPPTVRVG